ncbi:acyl-CoA dehydrogenase [Mycobacteroides chelonae]|uniref:Acyl-CoA dehydrogenase n=2 Tax=Mycobacteriaceae TaxID=1762 RepID=A0A1S1LTZ1_MYCCH|nr:acyl-CoA dehydrogenase [Mycobacteroides sp. H003]KRQ27670.1 acyl-CoA dehydrogenase [Mycobacteroides sp. H092]KRQ40769.1 acyl-CoA dehydrogenase [Mycobacteroides sp. H101]KRQ42465.1 acyl-CoA dehydrogenase [Mycobacteroides sp. H063]KRQ54701.1 acyl-CoA dehydrogenase [Mycobacteroides sp. HXVII]KRQ64166.1 acyl-CoA dehydrogenase [Mycobacteroides sp. H079]KRQ71994.1 acyl-CoA dehydrogenase [Mycobacteroides sp. H110]KRQ80491.1 acyl-CoA dehydrogenase [Mycobacteroides sp. HXXIII]OHU27032.1 acyl-CoA 
MDKDLDALADLARRFFEKECAPNEERWGRQQQVDRDVWRKAGELGLLCLSIPEEYGGGGGTFAHEAVVAIEQIRAMAPSFGGVLHSAIIAHYLSSYGTEEQKTTWLPKMASGEVVSAIAMTEPGTGSDLQAIKTKAVKDGDDYVISGAKTFISNGQTADLVVVAAKTDPEGRGVDSVSLILVEAHREGFRRGRNLEKIGQHGQDTCELFFDDVRVPQSNLVGAVEGLGFIQLMQQLPQERLVLAVIAAASIEKTVDVTLTYTKEREAFGRPIFKFQNTQFVLAESDTVKSVAWSFLDECVVKHLAGELDVPTAAKAKWWLTDQQVKVADECLQLFGGYGYMQEYPIARLYADSRIQKVYGGTNEIMKTIIAKSL